MQDKHELTATKRDLSVKPRVYRQDGQILANVFGEGASQAVALPAKATTKLLSEISESTVFYLTIDSGKALPVMISEVQRDAITSQIIHLAMRQVNLKEKVKAMIPISTTGEFDVPGAVYLLVKNEVEAEALPTDLPEEFIVDVSNFTAVGDQVTFADLDYDRAKVTLSIEHEQEPIVVVNEVKEEVEETPATTTESAEGAATEGDAATPAPETTAEAQN